MTQLCFVRGKCLLSYTCINPNRGPANQSPPSVSSISNHPQTLKPLNSSKGKSAVCRRFVSGHGSST